MKPWKISQNFIEKINSSNGAFSGLNNKHLKSLAIRASVRNVSARSLKFRNIATKYKLDSRQPDDKVPQTTSISVYFVLLFLHELDTTQNNTVRKVQ